LFECVSSPGGERLAGYGHGRRAATAPASRTAAAVCGQGRKLHVSLGLFQAADENEI